MKEILTNANFPRDLEGRVYHLGVKKGQVANHILTVGDHARAKAIAKCLDDPVQAEQPPFEHHSQRGFLTITGKYKGVPVSIMAIGMGSSMMDFFVRETRAVTSGTLVIARFGSCGSLKSDVRPGAVVIPEGGYCIRRNLDYFCKKPYQQEIKDQPYLISGVFPADPELTIALRTRVREALKIANDDRFGPVYPDETCQQGCLNADGCSFYSSQGRLDPNFDDENEELLAKCMHVHPDTISLEMESSMLFHLARCSKGTIRAAACMQVFADRSSKGFIHPDVVIKLEPIVGKAVLDALISIKLDDPPL